MIRKILATLSLSLTLGLAAFAQTTSHTTDFSSFSGISVGEGFSVTLQKSTDYRVTYEIEEILDDYIEVYANNGIVYFEYNRKALPSEVKKAVKAIKGGPTLEVTVYAPFVESITLSSSAKLDASGYVNDPATFSLVGSGSSKAEGLRVKCGSALVNLSNSAAADLVVDAEGEFDINTSGSSSLTTKQTSKKLVLAAEGSSSVILSGETVDAQVSGSSTSKTTLSGSAKTLTVSTQGMSAQVNAKDMEVNDASVTITGGTKVWVNAAEHLKVDIASGTLTFSENPVIEVVRVSKGSLLPEGAKTSTQTKKPLIRRPQKNKAASREDSASESEEENVQKSADLKEEAA